MIVLDFDSLAWFSFPIDKLCIHVNQSYDKDIQEELDAWEEVWVHFHNTHNEITKAAVA